MIEIPTQDEFKDMVFDVLRAGQRVTMPNAGTQEKIQEPVRATFALMGAVDVLLGRIAELEEKNAAREHAADAFEGYHPDDDMTVELAIELVEKDRRTAELEAMLVKLQWFAPARWPTQLSCLFCHEQEEHGHAKDCKLAALLPKEDTDEHTM